MADPVDEAQRLEDEFRTASIAAVLNRPVPADFDGKHCYNCGDEVPAARLAIRGVCRCVSCQEAIDNSSKHKRRFS